MRAVRIYLALTVICVYSATLPTAETAGTTSKYYSRTSNTYVAVSSTSNYYYMNDPTTCSQFGNIKYFSRDDSTAYLSSWNPTRSRTPLSYTCSVTFSSYGAYGMKYKFDSSNSYIDNCDVRLNIYDSVGAYGSMMASYSCDDSIPSGYVYTESGYLTMELVTDSFTQLTDYDFTITIKNYDDIHYYSGGDIAATVIAIFVFVLLIAGLVVCLRVRRRRRLLRETLIVSVPSNNYPVGPAPYPNSYGSITTTTVNPPPPTTVNPPPPTCQPAGYAGAPPPPAYAPAGAVESKHDGGLPPPPVYNS